MRCREQVSELVRGEGSVRGREGGRHGDGEKARACECNEPEIAAEDGDTIVTGVDGPPRGRRDWQGVLRILQASGFANLEVQGVARAEGGREEGGRREGGRSEAVCGEEKWGARPERHIPSDTRSNGRTPHHRRSSRSLSN